MHNFHPVISRFLYFKVIILQVFFFNCVFASDDDAILILTPPGELFASAIAGIQEETYDDFEVTVLELSKGNDDAGEIEHYFASTTPKVIVILGNQLLRLYTKFSHQHKPDVSGIPVISIYALDTERAIGHLNNAQGISSQTPMVTAITKFRYLVTSKVATVGVIYRDACEELVLQNTKLCQREGIAIRSIKIGDEAKKHKKEISNALKHLIKKEQVDALWVPNDNVILSSELLGSVWIPLLNRANIPVIVGVEVLVKPELNFGTFAVIPDPKGTGMQAADLIFDLKYNNWELPEIRMYPTLSVYSVLNYKKAAKIINRNNMNTITKIFE
ncbi:MAG: hypothetical protein GX639_02805 [Fibrobacter sp.]|nr:hypothetical protein [Fibrobacter sp.]